MQSTASKAPSLSLNFREFLFLVAAMMACQALAVDAMLPALPAIAQAIAVTNENRMQWVVTAYMAGLGVGQLFWGMMADRVGRRPVLLVGLALYVIAALLCGLATNFTALLAWRFTHGVAAASMVVARSMIRDLYEGRQMARVMSLTFIVFMLVPMIAPSLGQLILTVGSWRSLFIVFGVFAAVVWGWVLWRLPETLHPEYRMTLTVGHIFNAGWRVLIERASLWYTLAVTLVFGSVLAYVAMVQQIFQDVFQRPALMPSMFAVCAAAMAVGSFVNAKVVERLGMRMVSQSGLLMFIGATGLHVLVAALGFEQLWSFVLLQAITMSCIGFMVANFGAMAMEAMGEVAGVAAAVQGSISTIGGALAAALIGDYFNGTTLPLAVGTMLCGFATLACVLFAERGRLFQPHHGPAEAHRPEASLI